MTIRQALHWIAALALFIADGRQFVIVRPKIAKGMDATTPAWMTRVVWPW